MKRYIPLLVSILLLVVTSCKKNTVVLSEDDLIDVLVDLHMAEGIIYKEAGTLSDRNKKFEYYNYVYEKHGVTKAVVDSSINYYAYYAPELRSIYDEVVARLKERQQLVKTGHFLGRNEMAFTSLSSDLQVMDSAVADSVSAEIWRMKRFISLPTEGNKSMMPFSIPNDTSNKMVEVLFKASYEVFQNDCSTNPRVLFGVEYENGKMDSVEFVLEKTGLVTPVSLRLSINRRHEVDRIFGKLLKDDACPSAKHANIRNIRIYKLTQPILSDTITQQEPIDTLQVDRPDKKDRKKPLLLEEPSKR